MRVIKSNEKMNILYKKDTSSQMAYQTHLHIPQQTENVLQICIQFKNTLSERCHNEVCWGGMKHQLCLFVRIVSGVQFNHN